MYVIQCKVVLFTQFDFIVAITAINWPVFTRLKRHFGFGTALSAYYGVHFAWSPRAVSTIVITLRLPRPTAVRTAPRLILEATRCIKFLLSSCKSELLPTIRALEHLVLKAQWMTSSLLIFG